MKESVLGTIRHGRVDLDEPTDWPDGQRVILQPVDGEPIGTLLPQIELPIGCVMPFSGSPEYCKLLADQMGRISPAEPTPQELDFCKALAEVNRRYCRALKKLAD